MNTTDSSYPGANPSSPAPVLRSAPDLLIRPRGYTLDASFVARHKQLGDTSSSTVALRTTVLLPVYNESDLIERTFTAVLNFARSHPDFRFLFVDDGSSDSTPAILTRLVAHSRVAGISTIDLLAYTPNAGKGHAVKVGIEATESDLVLFTDGDLAYSLDHLPQLAAALDTSDVVIGSRSLVHRSERNTTLRRRIMGWTFNRCARVMLGLGYKDTQAGLKGFRREAARRIFAVQRLGGFAFDVELVYLARRLGFRISEIPAYVSEEHSYKRSKVDMLRDPIRMFAALADIRLNAILGRYGRR